MKNIIILLSLISIFVASFIGCSQRVGDFTMISTKNVEIEHKYTKLGRFEGEDVKGAVLGIPLGIVNLEAAVDNCIENGKGTLLTNVVIDYSWWTAFIYGQMTYTVIGDVWEKASVSDLLNPNEEIFELVKGKA